MKRRLAVYLIVFQLIVIFGIVYDIANKKNSTLGATFVPAASSRPKYIYPAVEGLKHFFELKPDTVNVIVPNWENTGGPEKPIYSINSDGLNQHENIDAQKPEGVFRVAAIGDSFTFGEYVNTEDNFPSKLQGLLEQNCKSGKFEMVNLAVGGYDIRYAVERYRIRGVKYEPDLMVWLVIDDDLRRIDEFLLPKNQQLEQKMKEGNMASGPEYAAWLMAKNEVIQSLGGEDEVLKMQEGYLRDLNKYYSRGLAVFTFKNSDAKYKSVLKDFVNSRGNSFYGEIDDLTKEGLTSLPDGHPSPLGHERMALSIFEQLRANRFIDCS